MKPLHVTAANFEVEVLQSQRPVLIDFWAPWCGPCRILAPTLDEIANEADRFKIVKINVDEEELLTTRFNIMSIPTLVVMDHGEEISRTTGVLPKAAILQMMGDI